MSEKSFTEIIRELKDRSSPCVFVDWNNIRRIKKIGEGYFGRVYEVTTPVFLKHLAVKVIDFNKVQDINLIFREIQILYSCCHPNILPLYGIAFNEEKQKIGLLTPFKWGNLAKVLENLYKGTPNNLPREFNNEIKQKIIFGISAGLYYLSINNILHRDIKPENILLDEDFNPYICDFGLAKEIHTDQNLYQTNWGIGTLPYIAPELFVSKKANRKIDIYSWAIVINCILEETMPYVDIIGSCTFHNLIDQIIKGKRPTMNKDRNFAFYQDLIERGWNSNDEERPSAEDILKELMKKEANLEGINLEIMDKYRMETLKATPDFLIQEIQKEWEQKFNVLKEQMNTDLQKEKTIPSKKQSESTQKVIEPEKSEILEMNKFEKEYKIETHYSSARKGFSPLHYAAEKNYRKIGEILISKGADINAEDIIYQIIL